MSIPKKKVIIYSNLPSGGADNLEKIFTERLSKISQLIKLNDSYVKPKNLLDYLIKCIFYLPVIHKRMAQSASDNSCILIAHHSWLTKSPHILRYYRGPKIYICQDLLREYYDPAHIAAQSFKDRIINALRLPIKYIDRANLKSRNLTVIVNSKYSKKLVDKFYKINSYVVYPGIDISEIKNSKRIKKCNQVISVGAINKLKRFDLFIKAIAKINFEIRPTLVLVGNGSDLNYVKYLESLSSMLNVKLKIKINISRKALIKEYNKSMVFVYAPISEPFGIVVQEAMAAGLPIVVYKNGGGYAEIVNSKNGIILDTLDLELWSSMLIRIIQNDRLLKQYSKFNLKYINKYDSKYMTNNLLSIVSSKL